MPMISSDPQLAARKASAVIVVGRLPLAWRNSEDVAELLRVKYPITPVAKRYIATINSAVRLGDAGFNIEDYNDCVKGPVWL